jgi:hypothetical protein
MRIIVPALLNVPQPRFIPHDDGAETETIGVVHATPNILAKLLQRRRLILGLASSPPPLNLAF